MPGEPSRQPSFAVLLGLAWLLMAGQMLAQGWTATALTFSDTDDALRLVEVRNFLAGQSWFDMREPRLGLPPGYESHWSRLIDVGLAGFFLFFRLFTDTAMAERLMGVTWPLVWLLPTLIGVAAIAWRLAGREAALIVLLLAVLNMPGMQQFKAGRIDHHNVQIALCLLAVAATMWSERVPWAGIAAGTITGWSLAIGLEALAFHALCGVALGLRYIVEPNAARTLRVYGFALAVSTALAFFVSVGPDHWTRSVCDALAVNLAGAVIMAGMGVGVAARPSFGPWTRLAAMLGVGVAVSAFYVAMQPQCLRGPFAQIDPGLWPIWLDHVSEGLSLPAMIRSASSTGIAMAAFPAVALVALLIFAYRTRRWRDVAFGLPAACFLISLAAMVGAIKAQPYVIWLGLPLVASAAPQAFAWLNMTRLVPRAFALLLLSPSIVTFGAISLASVLGADKDADTDASRVACLQRTEVAALAALPSGFVVANLVDWGAYLLAGTPHRVLSAPYHRLSESILTAHRIFVAPPDTARTILSQIGADYVVLCGTQGPVGVPRETLDASLWGRLQAGVTPNWLEPLQLDDPWRVYRVKSGL